MFSGSENTASLGPPRPARPALRVFAGNLGATATQPGGPGGGIVPNIARGLGRKLPPSPPPNQSSRGVRPQSQGMGPPGCISSSWGWDPRPIHSGCPELPELPASPLPRSISEFPEVGPQSWGRRGLLPNNTPKASLSKTASLASEAHRFTAPTSSGGNAAMLRTEGCTQRTQTYT